MHTRSCHISGTTLHVAPPRAASPCTTPHDWPSAPLTHPRTPTPDPPLPSQPHVQFYIVVHRPDERVWLPELYQLKLNTLEKLVSIFANGQIYVFCTNKEQVRRSHSRTRCRVLAARTWVRVGVSVLCSACVPLCRPPSEPCASPPNLVQP
jgi:hypothetical protein